MNGADINGRTAVTKASLGGHVDCVSALVRARADVNAKKLGGSTPLMWAALGGHLECVWALIDSGAEVKP